LAQGPWHCRYRVSPGWHGVGNVLPPGEPSRTEKEFMKNFVEDDADLCVFDLESECQEITRVHNISWRLASPPQTVLDTLWGGVIVIFCSKCKIHCACLKQANFASTSSYIVYI
jgi:hypothetical protein